MQGWHTLAGKARKAGIAGKAGISYLLEEIVLDGWNSMQYFKTRPLQSFILGPFG